MRTRRLQAVLVAWVVTVTGCGSHLSRGQLEASNRAFERAVTVPAAALAPAAAESASGGTGGTSGGAGAVTAGPGGATTAATSGASAGNTATGGGRTVTTAPRSAGVTGGGAGTGPADSSARVATPGAPGPGATPGPGSAAPAGQKSEVVLGSIGVEAGIMGAVTGPAPPAIRAWASYINARGGLAGHPVRIILVDDGNDPGRAQALVRQLVEKDKVLAFVNDYTLNTLSAVMPYLEQKQIPVIGSIGGDLVGGASPMMFNPLAGSFGLSHAWATLLTINAMTDKKKLGLVYCREVNGCQNYVNTIKKLLPYGGLSVVYEAQTSLAQPDYTAEMLQAQRSGAEVLFVLLDSSAIVRVARAAHRQGYQPTFVAAFNASHDLVLTGGNDVEGLLVGGRYAPWDSAPSLQMYRDAMASYQPTAPRGDLGGGVFVVGKLLETKIAPFLKEPPTTAQLLEGLYALDKETLGGLLPGISFPKASHEKVNLCTVPQRLTNGKFATRDAAASFVCAPGWVPATRGS